MKKDINYFEKLLDHILEDTENTPKFICLLQNDIWNLDFSLSNKEAEILGDLAELMDYYEPDPIARAECPDNLFDKKQLIFLVKQALKELKKFE